MTNPLAPSCLAVAAVFCDVMVSPTTAATADSQRKQYDIGGGDAAGTLKRMADESGKQIVFLVDVVRGVKTNPVKGEYTAREALDRMLADTGLVVARDEKTGALMINRAPRPGSAGSGAQPHAAVEERLRTNAGRPNLFALIGGWIALAVAPVGPVFAADLAGTGGVTGRVVNIATGAYLNNARVAIEGTRVETVTNEDGEYRLAHVPAGDVRLRVSYTGFEARTVLLRVAPGEVARQDLDLSLPRERGAAERDVVKLERFVVEATTLSAQAAALNEQRNAPNIKNVIVLDEIGDLGDGNLGEYLKYTPGIAVTFGPQTATSLSIRGMPASGVVFMMDGAEISSPSADREFDLAASFAGSVDRIEVTKVPTPDRPANAVGGTVNIIGKSGFSVPRRSLKLNTYLGYNAPRGVKPPGLNDRVGTDERTDARAIQPGLDLSYSHPVNKSFAFTISGSTSTRAYDMDADTSVWDLIRGVEITPTLQHALQVTERHLLSTAFDWKISRTDSLRLNLDHVQINTPSRQDVLTAAFGAGSVGDAHFTQGSPAGNDLIRQSVTWGDRTRGTSSGKLRYIHEGPVYRVEATANFSRSWDERKDVEHGFFNSIGLTQQSGLILRAEGLEGVYSRRAPRFTAVDRSGRPVDPYDSADFTMGSPTSSPNEIKSLMRQVSVNVGRDLPFSLSSSIKTGFTINHQEKDNTAQLKTWAFNPPGGAPGRLVKNLDVINEFAASQWLFSETLRAKWVSPAKFYDIYRKNPEYFVLNQSAAYISEATSSKFLEETISAAYVRGDVKFWQNRVWLVGGVRFEKTEDHGFGVLDDIRATYRQDANGNLIRDAAGRVIRVTNDSLESARLRYKVRGAEARKSYDGYYPSFNSTYYLTDTLVARAAYAKTIGRPKLTEIIPSMTITDPESTSVARTITVTNTGLQPWTADNFDLSFETYNLKGAVASVGLFRKDISNFFGATQMDATPELLAGYGLSDDYLDYDIVTKANYGKATIEGYELSWRQSLFFLPNWARGLQVFGNATITRLSGTNAADFIPFAHKNLNWGASFLRPRFSIKFNVAYAYKVTGAAVAASATVPPGTFTYVAPQITADASFEYRIMKRVSLYGSARNLSGHAKRQYRSGPGVPAHARPIRIQNFGSIVTFGVRSEF